MAGVLGNVTYGPTAMCDAIAILKRIMAIELTIARLLEAEK